jgi:hypothetical protein
MNPQPATTHDVHERVRCAKHAVLGYGCAHARGRQSRGYPVKGRLQSGAPLIGVVVGSAHAATSR